MRRCFAALLAVLAALSSGCAGVRFRNGDVPPRGRPAEHWHHNLALGLYEASPPLDMTRLCPGGRWSSVTVRERLATTVAGLVVGAGVLWDPEWVEYSCAKGGTESPANPEAPGPR